MSMEEAGSRIKHLEEQLNSPYCYQGNAHELWVLLDIVKMQHAEINRLVLEIGTLKNELVGVL